MELRPLALIAWSCLAALSACEQKAEPAPAPAASLAAAVPADQGLPEVRLLEAGSAPRRALRYRFERQERAVMEMVMAMGMKMTVGAAGPQDVALPPILMRMSIQPEPARADGSLRYAFRLDKTEAQGGGLDPNVLEAMRAELARTEGLAGEVLVDARGFTLEADMRVPPGAGQQVKDMVEKMRQQLRQMSCPLPEEPVGQGARWEVRTHVQADLFRVEQRAVYQLRSQDGERIELGVELIQSAPRQAVQLPQAPQARAELLGLESKGSGSMRVDLGSLVPDSRVTSQTRMKMQVAMGDQAPQEIVTDLTLELTIQPR
jgi:hypothetical protein